MNVLIITAHPSSEGFTHQIASRYSESAEAVGKSVEIIDLYDPRNQQGFLAFEDMRDIQVDTVGRRMRDALTKADEIILVFPMWWFSMPAIMKNFFDTNMGAGFAFQYIDGKPQPLLTGKKARIMTTADGPQMLYRGLKAFFSVPLAKGILGFCGIKTVSVDIFAGRSQWKGSEKEREILAKVAKYAKI